MPELVWVPVPSPAFCASSEIGFLGEEEGITSVGDGLMRALDPLDGTANFTHGIPLCGTSLGLIDHDRSILA